MDIRKKLKIAVAMSGGVDSSVAAKLLYDQGHDVTGVFLYFWHEDNPSGALKGLGGPENKCCSSGALLDARRAAAKIGIRLLTLDFTKVFKKQVVDDFLSEYARGRTPNPCVRCNKLVKLGFLIKAARKLGFDYLASGHYARLWPEIPNSKSSRRQDHATRRQSPKNAPQITYKLYKAKDENKDQSYFLHTLNQYALKHLLFPLGDYTKSEVRQMAKKFDLPVAEKPDSQEICFVPDKNHNDFLKRHLKLKPGPIKLLTSPNPLLRKQGNACPLGKEEIRGIKMFGKAIIPLTPFIKGEVFGKGRIIGRHQGLPLYTIGQRKGINLGHGPFYAAKMDYKKNILYVVGAKNENKIFSRDLIAKNVNWISQTTPPARLNCQAMTRYRQKAVACRLSKIKGGAYKVKFARPLRAIMPGQSVVFYRGWEVLGGGVIAK